MELIGLGFGILGAATAFSTAIAKWFQFPHSRKTPEESSSGLRILIDPENPQVDVVLVHGLGGHPRKSWTYSDATTEEEIFWPVEILPEDLPLARVMTYGWKSELSCSLFLTQGTLYQHSSFLLTDLTKARCTPQEERRPLIFIGHSLGGLFIKSALIFSSESESYAIRAVELSTCGIIFFGTPHQGSRTTTFGKALTDIAISVTGQENSEFIETLERDSIELEFKLQRFKALAEDFQMCSFYESEPNPVSGLVIIEKSVAVPAGKGYWSRDQPLPADHFSMCKLSGLTDSKYAHMLLQLKDMYSNSKVKAKWEKVDELKADNLYRGDENFNVPPILPYLLNDSLITRPEVMERLDSILFPTAPMPKQSHVAVLLGPGGIGKTQLAREYARFKTRICTSILWINAENRKSIENGFAQIAQHVFDHQVSLNPGSESQIALNLNLPLKSKDGYMKVDMESQQGQDLVVQAVKEWLTRKRNTKWLLIFDSFESNEAIDFIPNTLVGHVIITTRFAGARCPGTVINVEGLAAEPALRLLLRDAKKDVTQMSREERDSAATIASHLGGLPLAISRVAQTINENGYSFLKYEQAFFNSLYSLYSDVTTFVEHFESQTARRIYRESLQTTWEEALDQIEEQSARAYSLLILCTLLVPNGVPVRLFHYGLQVIPEPELNDLLRVLTSQSLLRHEPKTGILRIHGVIAIAVRERLDDHLRSSFALRTCCLLSRATFEARLHPGPNDVENSMFRRQLLPHIQTCLQWADLVAKKDVGWGHLASNCADHGYYAEAAQCYNLDLAFLSSSFANDPDGSRQAESWLGLSSVLLQQGHLKDAEDKVRSMITQLDLLSQDATEGLRFAALRILAKIMTAAERFYEAEELYEEILEYQERTLGVNNPETSTTLSFLASSWRNKGDCHEPAEMLNRRLVTSCTKVFGLGHLTTFEASLELALICQQQGKFSEAEQFYTNAFTAMETKLGPEHPNTLKVVARLAKVADLQGRHEEAMKRYEPALTGMQNLFGHAHPEVLKIEQNIALSFLLRRDYTEVDRRYRRVLTIMKESPSTYSEEVLSRAFSKLSDIYRREEELPWDNLMALKRELGLSSVEILVPFSTSF